MNSSNKFQLSNDDKIKIEQAIKKLSSALLTAKQAAKGFTNAAKKLNECLPTAEQANKRLTSRKPKPYYRMNDKF